MEVYTPAASKTGDRNTAESNQSEENPFVSVATNPRSTFPLGVGTGSYVALRDYIRSGTRPPKDAVRIEEIINYFPYDYPAPDADSPFAIHLDASGLPVAG